MALKSEYFDENKVNLRKMDRQSLIFSVNIFIKHENNFLIRNRYEEN